MMSFHQRRNRGIATVAAALVPLLCGFLLFSHSHLNGIGFTVSSRTAASSTSLARSGSARESSSKIARAGGHDLSHYMHSPGMDKQFYNIRRMEAMIKESCAVKSGAQRLECMRVWDKFTIFNDDSIYDCGLSDEDKVDIRCEVIEVLERLASQIRSQDGIIRLVKVGAAALAFRSKHMHWESEFNHKSSLLALDNSGYFENGGINADELKEAIYDAYPLLTEEDAKLLFYTADANEDGIVDKEEMKTFLTAAVFASDFAELQCSQEDDEFTNYLQWCATGRGGSWAGFTGVFDDTPLLEKMKQLEPQFQPKEKNILEQMFR